MQGPDLRLAGGSWTGGVSDRQRTARQFGTGLVTWGTRSSPGCAVHRSEIGQHRKKLLFAVQTGVVALQFGSPPVFLTRRRSKFIFVPGTLIVSASVSQTATLDRSFNIGSVARVGKARNLFL